jgi:hypothetical protein
MTIEYHLPSLIEALELNRLETIILSPIAAIHGESSEVRLVGFDENGFPRAPFFDAASMAFFKDEAFSQGPHFLESVSVSRSAVLLQADGHDILYALPDGFSNWIDTDFSRDGISPEGSIDALIQSCHGHAIPFPLGGLAALDVRVVSPGASMHDATQMKLVRSIPVGHDLSMEAISSLEIDDVCEMASHLIEIFAPEDGSDDVDAVAILSELEIHEGISRRMIGVKTISSHVLAAANGCPSIPLGLEERGRWAAQPN